MGGSNQSSFNISDGKVAVVSAGEKLRVWCDYDVGDWEICLWYRPNTNRSSPLYRNTVKIYHSTLSLLGLLRIFSLIFLLIALIPTGNISGRVVTLPHYQVILVTCNEIT